MSLGFKRLRGYRYLQNVRTDRVCSSSRCSLASIWSWDWARLELYFYTTPTPLYRHAVYRDILTCSFAGTQYFERFIGKMERTYFTEDDGNWLRYFTSTLTYPYKETCLKRNLDIKEKRLQRKTRIEGGM